MNLPKYRVFVCTKQRADGRSDCCSAGALDIYQKFQSEIADRKLAIAWKCDSRDVWIGAKLVRLL
ncbi:MAG: hypothetical protein HC778_08825 [Chamaesiphon sp. CSU_1_12]|nr:hypothetical protein [Chamaesiphon sp. CSU_1_12]